MSAMYVGGTLPPIPKMPAAPADDDNRAQLRWDYESFLDAVKNGGAKAFNAIAIQGMRRTYKLLTAPVFDLDQANRVSTLMTA